MLFRSALLQRAKTGRGQRVSVSLYEGCNHSLDQCRVKFSNAGNCGAFVGIPDKNPMSVPLTELM